jgi:hypothetical protein
MVNQEANNGRASIWRVRLRPIKLEMLPVGMAPKHAPRVRREPIQAPCASVIFRSDFSNIGRAGEVQVRHIPKQRAIRVAKVEARNWGNFLGTDSDFSDKVSRVLEFSLWRTFECIFELFTLTLNKSLEH